MLQVTKATCKISNINTNNEKNTKMSLWRKKLGKTDHSQWLPKINNQEQT